MYSQERVEEFIEKFKDCSKAELRAMLKNIKNNDPVSIAKKKAIIALLA